MDLKETTNIPDGICSDECSKERSCSPLDNKQG